MWSGSLFWILAWQASGSDTDILVTAGRQPCLPLQSYSFLSGTNANYISMKLLCSLPSQSQKGQLKHLLDMHQPKDKRAVSPGMCLSLPALLFFDSLVESKLQPVTCICSSVLDLTNVNGSQSWYFWSTGQVTIHCLL